MRISHLIAAALVGAVLATPAAASSFFDPVTRQWVDYSARGVPSGKSPIRRERVRYEGSYAPGTIIIDTSERRLYHVLPNGRAMKYGIGVGREGFQWAGTQRISRKAEWPGWTPPPQMRARERAKGKILPAHMPGGPNNPLGARAMYLGSSLYRIHGSNEPWTIGTAVSSGCIRMANDDVVHLYDNVDVGAKVVVKR
ncbi:L,D-transpeptidase [Stappia sp. MMSF_3263]|uniref:L,D-transpeptidase n=1 Tax=Stappia sp. MMSF_3263 TaxID=3046693 RepID=UPI00273DE822|nr:L,D-transpeptidase [Stappia sp. MMSF_3263]